MCGSTASSCASPGMNTSGRGRRQRGVSRRLAPRRQLSGVSVGVATWLTAIARNKAISACRQRRFSGARRRSIRGHRGSGGQSGARAREEASGRAAEGSASEGVVARSPADHRPCLLPKQISPGSGNDRRRPAEAPSRLGCSTRVGSLRTCLAPTVSRLPWPDLKRSAVGLEADCSLAGRGREDVMWLHNSNEVDRLSRSNGRIEGLIHSPAGSLPSGL